AASASRRLTWIVTFGGTCPIRLGANEYATAVTFTEGEATATTGDAMTTLGTPTTTPAPRTSASVRPSVTSFLLRVFGLIVTPGRFRCGTERGGLFKAPPYVQQSHPRRGDKPLDVGLCRTNSGNKYAATHGSRVRASPPVRPGTALANGGAVVGLLGA